MATDIFGAKGDSFKKFHAGKATVSIGTLNAIALNVTVSFQRTVEPVPVLGSTRVLSVGEPTGNLTIQSLLSSGDILSGWSDACHSDSITLTFTEAECGVKGGGTGKTITCHNCMLQSVSMGAQGGRGYVSEDVVFTFTALEVE